MEQLYLFWMKLSGVIIIVSLCRISTTVDCEDIKYELIRYNLNDAPKLFEDLVKKYNKTYISEPNREEHYEAFRKHLKVMNEYNGFFKYPMVIDEFSDYTSTDFEIFRNLSAEANKSKWPDHEKTYDLEEFPDLFEKFIKIYNRNYESEDVKQMRYKCFRIRLERLNSFNIKWILGPHLLIDDTYDFTDKELAEKWNTTFSDMNDKKKLKATEKDLLPAPAIEHKMHIYNESDLERVFEKCLKDPNFSIPIVIDNEEKKKQRFECFKENVHLINELNKNFLAPFIITPAAFLTKEERRQRRKSKLHRKEDITLPPAAPLPDPSHPTKQIYNLDKVEELFEDFIKRYSKTYETEEDRKKCFESFKRNLQNLNWLNENFSYTFVINKFCDYSPEELHDFFMSEHQKIAEATVKNKLKPENGDHTVYIHWQRK